MKKIMKEAFVLRGAKFAVWSAVAGAVFSILLVAGMVTFSFECDFTFLWERPILFLIPFLVTLLVLFPTLWIGSIVYPLWFSCVDSCDESEEKMFNKRFVLRVIDAIGRVIDVINQIMWPLVFCLGSLFIVGNFMTGNVIGRCIIKAARQGDVKAQYKLGKCYERGMCVPKDETKAVKWYRKAGEQGDAKAQYELGYCYERGDGVSKDKTEAAKWFSKAAEQGNADAMDHLVCYGYDLGLNDTEMVKWYRMAAEQGYGVAQFHLGRCYKNGVGVVQNKGEAVKWFSKINPDWQFTIGCRLYEEGGEHNKTEAVKWWRKAAERGERQAQLILGYCYERGAGVSQDKTEAAKWYRKAGKTANHHRWVLIMDCDGKSHVHPSPLFFRESVPQDKAKAVK